MTDVYKESIIVEKLDCPNIDTIANDYGVNFVPLPLNMKTDLFNRVDAMLELAPKLRPDLINRALLYLPRFVLDVALTPEKKHIINEIETEEIARFTTKIQDQLMKVPIDESYEHLVYVPELFSKNEVNATFSDKPFHESCGEWAGKKRQFWVRGQLGERMVVLGKLLNAAGVQLNIEDAFRPVGVQEGLFKRRIDWTRRDYPEWSAEQVIVEARSKTASCPRLASHKAGAAIDATICDENKRNLSFGHDYPDGGALVFPRSPFITGEHWRNRQLFQVAAGLSGLTLYVGEDWHISHGDNLASLDHTGNVVEGYRAKYGPIKQIDIHGNQATVVEVYDETELDSTFPIS